MQPLQPWKTGNECLKLLQEQKRRDGQSPQTHRMSLTAASSWAFFWAAWNKQCMLAAGKHKTLITWRKETTWRSNTLTAGCYETQFRGLMTKVRHAANNGGLTVLWIAHLFLKATLFAHVNFFSSAPYLYSNIPLRKLSNFLPHKPYRRGSVIGRLRIRIRVGEPYSYTLTFGSATDILTKRIRIRRRPGETCSTKATQPYYTCVQAHSRSLRIHFTAEFAPIFHSRKVNS